MVNPANTTKTYITHPTKGSRHPSPKARRTAMSLRTSGITKNRISQISEFYHAWIGTVDGALRDFNDRIQRLSSVQVHFFRTAILWTWQILFLILKAYDATLIKFHFYEILWSITILVVLIVVVKQASELGSGLYQGIKPTFQLH